MLAPVRTAHALVPCLLLSLGVSTHAAALPLSRFTERVSGSGINESGADDNAAENIAVNVPGFYGKAETSGSGGAVLPLGPGGPSAEAVLDVVGDQSGVVSANVTYYFGVEGPALAGPGVPLIIEAMLLVEAEPSGVITTDTASINVFAAGVIDVTRSLDGCSGMPVVCQDRRQDLVFDLGMPIGLEGSIVLRALLQTRGAGEGVRVRAVADPLIRIDPAFELADQYQIVVSSGVSNTPAVPESSSLRLLAAGLAGLAVLGRARR
jgi:hypothetical protein